ncbi:MAG: hypothetical protein COU22_00270 [Candidatus Komeilibacteria bacterium CG10_big_fil_rev_8_21_14_0_10_41_13]|uniref:dolichyl-phosphate beta-glucosyltransferase n=1 Tax=Candidatus Komeilibacteria bacterium CG10_big_fil_rev_8_21_14_0_10_41_13 TaxID=1974476 RepID=A0A2M6WDA8_9BACT|nr:MAG: hypothetical protein COU22_00270 [Candidatus Komeilibacteria bacterium CG10_big_fil_rev_8_21_14_0_10_41_13]
MKVSVIIPAYNEEKRLSRTLTEVLGSLKDAPWPYEIIVVDDGSRDKTSEIARETPQVRVIRHQINLGKGRAVKAGVAEAKGELILFMDADHSTPIEELNNFLKAIDHYDIIIGSRALKDSEVIKRQGLIKELSGKLGNRLIRLVTGLDFQDTQCGFKLFNRSSLIIFNKQTLDRWGFDFELLLIAKKAGFKILEMPVKWQNDSHSKVTFFSYFQTLSDLIKIYFNNLQGKYDIWKKEEKSN